MITWVLVEEPTVLIGRALEIIEARLGSKGEVSWVSPVVDPIQD